MKDDNLMKRLNLQFNNSAMEVLKEKKPLVEYNEILESLGEEGYEEDFEEEIEESYRFAESSGVKKGRTEESVKESLMSMKESIEEDY